MKKRRVLIALLMAATMAFGVSAAACDGCNGDGGSGGTGGGNTGANSGNTGDHEHDYGAAGIQLIEATCTEDGLKYGVCQICGNVVNERYEALGHNYVRSEEAATCVKDGVYVYTCSNKGCNEEYSEISVRCKGHDLVGAEWKFTSETLVEGSECEYTVVESATCKAEGCGETVKRQYGIHKPNYSASVEEATCQKGGKISYVCACRNEKYKYSVDTEANPNAHHWVAANSGNVTHECDVAGCKATKSQVEVSGTSAQIAAADLAKENVVISMTDTNTTMQPDKALLEKLGSSNIELTAETVSKSSVTVSDTAAAKKIEESGSEIYNFDLKKDDESVNFDGGKMTISIPYVLSEGEDPNLITILYIAEDGSCQECEAVYSNGYAVFEAEHFSYYTVVRVSAAERCAKIGHDYQYTVVNPTCLEAGYTIQYCRRCGDYSTQSPVNALGHDYEETVIAPTCTEQGYTYYECKRDFCNDSYVSKFVKEIPHTYSDNLVAPTCTKGGYTEHVCGGCGKQYRDAYTDATGHSYSDGVCSVCGAKEKNLDANNIYLNLIESVANIRSYYMSASDVHFQTTLKVDGELRNEVKYDMDLYRVSVTLDDDGNLLGKAEGKMAMTSKYTSNGVLKESTSAMDMKIAFRGDKIYMYEKETQSANGVVLEVNEVYNLEIPDNNGPQTAYAQMAEMLKKLYTDEVKNIVDGVKNLAESPLNGVISKVAEYVFKKESTADGYTFTFDIDHIYDVYNAVTTESFKTVVEKVFGEGSLEKIYNWVKAAPSKTVDQFVGEVTVLLNSIGVDNAELYPAINNIIKSVMEEMSGGAQLPTEVSEITVESLLEQYKDMTLAQLVIMLAKMEGATQESVTQMWTGIVDEVYASLCDEETPCLDIVYTVIANFAMSRPGNGNKPVETPDNNGGIDMPGGKPEYAPYYSSEEVASMSLVEMLKKYETLINDGVAAFRSGVTISFKTDAYGALMNMSIVVDGFDYTVVVPDHEESGEVNVLLSGSLAVMPGGDYSSNVDAIVTAIDSAVNNFKNIPDGTKLVGKYDGYYGRGLEYEFRTIDGITVLMPILEVNNDNIESVIEYLYESSDWDDAEGGKATYNGQDCEKITYSIDAYAYIILPEKGLSYSKDCGSWYKYNVLSYESSSYYNAVRLTIYYVGQEILGSEVDVSRLIEAYNEYQEMPNYSGPSYGHITNMTIYYNSSTHKYSLNTQHNYIVVEKKEDAKCEDYNYVKYRCTVCGRTYYNRSYVWHETDAQYEFKDASKGCEGGIVVKYVCRVCGKVTNTYERDGVYENGRHYTVRHETPLNTVCGDTTLYVDKCLCGEYIDYARVYGRCEFFRSSALSTECSASSNGLCSHGYMDHRTDVYVCAVTNCQYKYSKEFYYKPTSDDCVYTSHTIFKVYDDKTITVTYTPTTTKIHQFRWVDSTNGNIEIEEYKCAKCGYVSELRKEAYRTFNVDGEKITVQTYQFRLYKSENGDKDYGYGWERVYSDPCHYVEYSLDVNEQREGSGSSGTYHRGYSYDESTEGELIVERTACRACGTQVGVNKYQVFVSPSEQEYTRKVYSLTYGEGGYELEFLDNTCNYVKYYLDGSGNRTSEYTTGVDHIEIIEVVSERTCTQFGKYLSGCIACNTVEYFYREALGHDYYHFGETYYCYRCGLENETSVRGPIDLEETIVNDVIEIGYNVKCGRDVLDIEVYVNFGLDNEVKLNVDVDKLEEVTTRLKTMSDYDIYDRYGFWPLRAGLRCGTAYISKDRLIKAIEEELNAKPELEIENINIAFVAQGKGTSDDEYPDYIYNVMNYLPEEILG